MHNFVYIMFMDSWDSFIFFIMHLGRLFIMYMYNNAYIQMLQTGHNRKRNERTNDDELQITYIH